MLAIFGNLGPWEIMLIVLVILLLFGAKKLPELAQGLGKGMKEFKRAVNDVQDDMKVEDKPESKKDKDIEEKKGTTVKTEEKDKS